MRFLHMADIHLGNQQYNSAARFNDFYYAFEDAVNLAIQEQVDACVIAGDLFHKTAIDPLTLLQAEEGLTCLQQQGIPVIGVHGNHDKARYRDQFSWVEYLADRGLIRLLAPHFEIDPLQLEPGDSYVDVDRVRFIGVPWLGASAARVLAQTVEACERLSWQGIAFTVLVTHAGVEGQMPDMAGCLSHAELALLKRRVQYLALGHLHKPYPVDGWIYNPGSLEACSFEETDYERGVYLVTVNRDGSHHAEHIKLHQRNRPFSTLLIKTDACAAPGDLLEETRAAARREARRLRALHHPDPDRRGKPVVRVILDGYLTFDRTHLDVEAIREAVWDGMSEIDPLLVRVENRTRPPGFVASAEENLTRSELERLVFEDIARSDTRFSLQAAAIGDLMLQIKRLAVNPQSSPQEIYDVLDRYLSGIEGA